MACRFYDNCEHHSGWCKADNMISNCTYGLNRIIAEHTLDKIELEKKIKKLESENDFMKTLLKTAMETIEQFNDCGIDTNISIEDAIADLQNAFKEQGIELCETGGSL